MTLYFITGSKNKFEEIQSIIPNIEQLDLSLPEIQSIDAEEIIKAKLQEALKHKDAEFIVEDTSLYFDELNGLPGPLIKWFMKTIGNQGLPKLVTNKSAKAKTIIGYAKNPENIHFFEGVINGQIVEPKGETNFGWDPIFQPVGYDKTFAELSPTCNKAIGMASVA